MESKAITTSSAPLGPAIEQVLVSGNLANLTPEQRVSYYNKTCDSLGLNPLTRPFEYITLNGKLTLYARKDCTEQLRSNRKVSIAIAAREVAEGVYVVTARATDSSGRADESIGAVPIDKLQGEARANAMMKSETKAKRRVTLSFCGLGILDESEVESVPDARIEPSHSLPIAPRAQPVVTIDTTAVPVDEVPLQGNHADPVEDSKTKAAKVRALVLAIKDAGIIEIERKRWMSEQVGHPVETSKSLSDAELTTLTRLAREMVRAPIDDEPGARG